MLLQVRDNVRGFGSAALQSGMFGGQGTSIKRREYGRVKGWDALIHNESTDGNVQA